MNILHKRPRFEFTESYFVNLYRAENVCLRLHCNLIKSVLDKQASIKLIKDSKSNLKTKHSLSRKDW